MKLLPTLYSLCCLLTSCTPNQTQTEVKATHYIQLRITGTNVKNVRSWIRTKSKYHKIGMFLKSNGGPSQDIVFQNTDTIAHTFPIGKEEVPNQFDTTSIGPNERLVFAVKMEGFKPPTENKSPTSATKFKVELLADGKVVQYVQIPTITKDSAATLVFDTNNLYP
ncbi:MAG: hypothetical protein H7Z21_05280 [Hymenobacter sp.]|nr:hypothetical protein [Hymenobacter sp.]